MKRPYVTVNGQPFFVPLYSIGRETEDGQKFVYIGPDALVPRESLPGRAVSAAEANATVGDLPGGWTAEDVVARRNQIREFGFGDDREPLLLFVDACRLGIFTGYQLGWVEAAAAFGALVGALGIGVAGLTQIQINVLRAVQDGKDYRTIREEQFPHMTTEEGVRYHVRQAAAKLGIPVRELRRQLAAGSLTVEGASGSER